MPKVNHNQHALPDDGLVPIRTASSLTGVNAVTLRAWERRYGLVEPIRTPKGHRMYTMADVELIQQVVSLLDSGMSIGQVRQVLDTDRTSVETPTTQISDFWQDYQQRLLHAITLFDEGALNNIYHEILSLYPVDTVTTRLITPLLYELGERWVNGTGTVAEEHFFSLFLRNTLGARFHHLNHNRRGAKLLAACLPDERHDVGILLFALAALDRDYRVILLGADIPLSELTSVVKQAGVHAIVLSGTMTTLPTEIKMELADLCQSVAIPVWIGGKIAHHEPKRLAAAGAIPLGDDLTLALHKIDATLNYR